MKETYTEQDLRDAYEDGYYEGAGDDAWYRDHSNQVSDLNADADVHRPMNEYIKELNSKYNKQTSGDLSNS